jgi:hypothetical protein
VPTASEQPIFDAAWDNDRRLFPSIPRHRLLTPDAEILAVVSGNFARTQTYARSCRKELFNHAVIYLTAATLGVPLPTANREDFGVSSKLPGGVCASVTPRWVSSCETTLSQTNALILSTRMACPTPSASISSGSFRRGVAIKNLNRTFYSLHSGVAALDALTHFLSGIDIPGGEGA